MDGNFMQLIKALIQIFGTTDLVNSALEVDFMHQFRPYFTGKY
jgi:hypothetical protein